jgi:glutamate receptor, ionotropic, plant
LRNGPAVLKEILQNKFEGLSGYFDLSGGQLQASKFQIINVVGKTQRVIGVWIAEGGISRQLDQRRSNTAHWSTTPNLKVVIWPGESTNVPRGWEIPINGKKLKVGVVTAGGGYQKYISGLAIDVFEEAIQKLPYALPYEYVVFNITENVSSSYDDFIYNVFLKVRIKLKS